MEVTGQPHTMATLSPGKGSGNYTNYDILDPAVLKVFHKTVSRFQLKFIGFTMMTIMNKQKCMNSAINCISADFEIIKCAYNHHVSSAYLKA
jgi:hypothetical protein